MNQPLCHHHVPADDCSICAARRRIDERCKKNAEEVGFKPTALCPICDTLHVIEYELHGIPLIACSAVKSNELWTSPSLIGLLSTESKHQMAEMVRRYNLKVKEIPK